MLLNNRVVKAIFLLTVFIQFNYHILEALYLCNHEALELQREVESCWGEETPLPRRGPDSSLAGICMAQSDSSDSLSRLWRVPAPSRLPCVLCPGARFTHCCSVLPGSCPSGGERSLDPQKSLSSRPCLLQPHCSPPACGEAGARGDLGTEDQTSCHEMKGASAELPPQGAAAHATSRDRWGRTWPPDRSSTGVTGQDLPFVATVLKHMAGT